MKKPDAGQPELKLMPDEIRAFDDKTWRHSHRDIGTRYVRADLPTATPTEKQEGELIHAIGRIQECFMEDEEEWKDFSIIRNALSRVRAKMSEIQAEYRAHDQAAIDVMYQISVEVMRILDGFGLQSAERQGGDRRMCQHCQGSGESQNKLNDPGPCEFCHGEGYLTTQKSPDKHSDVAKALEAKIVEIQDENGELNENKYNHDDVCELNRRAINVHNMLESLAVDVRCLQGQTVPDWTKDDAGHLASLLRGKGMKIDQYGYAEITHEKVLQCLRQAFPKPPVAEVHSDDIAVDKFCAAMKAKLSKKRKDGRAGWESCTKEALQKMMADHLQKGDPIDVANFCMFLWSLGYPVAEVNALPESARNLLGTIRYIATQAKLAHPGALQVIRENAMAAIKRVLGGDLCGSCKGVGCNDCGHTGKPFNAFTEGFDVAETETPNPKRLCAGCGFEFKKAEMYGALCVQCMDDEDLQNDMDRDRG